MNNEIHNAFVNALLADASYVDGLQSGDTGAALAGQLAGRLTDPDRGIDAPLRAGCYGAW